MMILIIIFLSICLVFLMGSLVALQAVIDEIAGEFVTKTNDEVNRMKLERNNKLETISNYYDEI